MSATPPHSIRIEQQLLGATLTMGAVGERASAHGVTPDDFYRHRHRDVWAAIEALLDRGAQPETALVADEMRARGTLAAAGGEACLTELLVEPAALGNLAEYARRVRRMAEDRRLLIVHHEMLTALQAGDQAAYAELEPQLESRLGSANGRRVDHTPDDLAEMFLSALEAQDVRRFRYPFDRLNTLSGGGARGGNVVLILGPTSHSKSAWVDQVLDHMDADASNGVRLYLNEMEPEERVNRIVARRSGVSLDRIEAAVSGHAPLTPREIERTHGSLPGQPIHITLCAGWTMQQIVRHARKRPDDVICVDIINRLPRRAPNRTAELEEASGLLDELAKTTGKLVIVVAHINRGRLNHDGTIPIPVVNDLKDAVQLGNDCDHAIAVWREQDRDTKDPTDDALIRFVKCRGGQRGGVWCYFDGAHMLFSHPREHREYPG